MPALAVLILFARPDPVGYFAGLAMAVLAEALRVWASGTIHKTQVLTTGGPYSLVRHPLYVGSSFQAVGYCLMSGQWLGFVLGMPFFLLLYLLAAFTEERMLTKLYGDAYSEYSRSVPRYFPRRLIPERGATRFSWRQVLWNREHVNICCLLLVAALFAAQMLR